MTSHPRVVYKRRETITELPLYYSGELLKKHNKDKEFKKYYAELRGASLFLYKDQTQDTYTEKLDLEKLKSMELNAPYEKKAPTIFTLKLHKEEVQLKMDNPDTGEEWRGYILTVIHKEIPSKLLLLPGQIMQLEEVLAQEKRRNPQMAHPPLPPRPAFLRPAGTPPSIPSRDNVAKTPEVPACLLNVTRQEAEQMLEANPEYGSMILRPSTLANNYALTLRQMKSSGPVMKNFRVTSTSSGFVIELDTPVTVASLNDVLQYFTEKTEYRLFPYMSSKPYDTHIDLSPPPKCISLTSPTPKTVPKAQVSPMLQSKTKEKPLPCPTKAVENEYVLPDEQKPGDHKQKKVHFDGELREAIKLRRGTIDSDSEVEEAGTSYKNTTSKKKAGWASTA
ncbi:signal-transducing adaptor protein 1 [Larimichthys crocea]|uniref:signal-transducing adaptor protein 1 n=1 Tax=Larimichthys crocea TaxID=215358 RepID=UPI000900F223|nr:signal-transducing adaptor protein 1 [Larimichthys crocea]